MNGILFGIVVVFLYLLFCGIPIVLVINNFLIMVRNKRSVRFEYIDVVSIVLGAIYVALFWGILNYKEYHEVIVWGGTEVQVHAPIAGEHMLTIVTIYLLAYGGYILLRRRKLDLSPLVYVLSWAFVLLGNLLGVVVLIQLWENLFTFNSEPLLVSSELYLILPAINFLICSITLLRELNKQYMEERPNKPFENKVLQGINLIIVKSNNWILVVIAMLFPILIILIAILIIFGQEADSLIKAFTETSDWTLSQKISPPPIEYDGHYLCTVALRGHEDIVKPKRYGLRGGRKIVVNRQLMVANAFEDMITEKFPRFHRFIRDIYDRYGYPLSKHITSSYKADLTYILMKPLEYIFILCLYLVDKKPENRIERQYLPIEFMNKVRS